MPTFVSSLYPSGYSGGLIGSRKPNAPRLRLNNQTGRMEPITASPKRSTGVSNSSQVRNLINLITKGQGVTKKEYDVPWDYAQNLMNSNYDARQEYNVPWQGYQNMLSNPGMSAEEANSMYGQQSDTVSKYTQQALENLGRNLPSGIGAIGEGQREIEDTAQAQRLGAYRDINLERLKSQREGKETALAGLSGLAQGKASAGLNTQAQRVAIAELLANLSGQRNEADLTRKNQAGELLTGVLSGNISSDMLRVISQAIRSGNRY